MSDYPPTHMCAHHAHDPHRALLIPSHLDQQIRAWLDAEGLADQVQVHTSPLVPTGTVYVVDSALIGTCPQLCLVTTCPTPNPPGVPHPHDPTVIHP